MGPLGEIPSEKISEFAGFKVFIASPFTEEIFVGLVQDSTFNPPDFSLTLPGAKGPTFHISRTLKELGCQTVLIEHDYKDRDYISEFSTFYAKRLRIPVPLCTRLHFFTETLPFQGRIESIAQIDALEDAAYLGFCVVRPTEFNRIARTVIKYPERTNEHKMHFLTCQESFSSHIFGRKFEIYGTPFIQQDTQVGACAHAVLWMVARYMHALGHCEEILPNEINDLAKSHQTRGRRYPANDGLVPVQMLEALDGMGLSAIDYNYLTFEAKHRSEKAQLIYNYVESGFPVIMDLQHHVVLAIGHTLNKDPRSEMRHVPSFIIHDDLIGPYLEFPLRPSGDRPVGVPVYDLEQVDGIIAIVPDSAKLKGEYAEAAVRSFLKAFNEKTREKDPVIEECRKTGIKFPDSNSCSYRNYLIKTVDFQKELFDELNETLPPEYVEVLLRLEYPRYIWVTEIYSATEECLGKFILDSTAARWDRSILAILLEKGIFLFDRQHLQTSPYIANTVSPCKIVPRRHPDFTIRGSS